MTDDPTVLAASLIAAAILLIGAAAAILLRQFASDKLERRVLGVVGVDRVAAQDPSAAPLGAVGRFLQ